MVRILNTFASFLGFFLLTSPRRKFHIQTAVAKCQVATFLLFEENLRFIASQASFRSLLRFFTYNLVKSPFS